MNDIIIKGRKIPFWLIAVLMYIFFVFLHLFLAKAMYTPIIFGDELGPWMKARFIATGRGLFDQWYIVSFPPGYSLFLVPIFLFIKDMALAYKAALVLNVLLISTIPVLVLILARKIYQHENQILTVLISILVGLYPAYMLYSNVLMTEVILAPFVLSLFILAYFILTKKKYYLWIFLGFFSGFAFIFHARLLILLLSSIILSILWKDQKDWKGWLRQIFYTIFGVGVGLFLVNFLSALITPQEIVSAQFTPYTSSVKSFELLIKTVSSTFLIACGHIFYLMASTYGLFFIGFFTSALSIFNIIFKKDRTPLAGIHALFFLTMLLSIVLSAFNSDYTMPGRFDGIIYGRYNEAFLAALLMVALFELFNASKKKIILWAIATLGMMTFFFVVPSVLYSQNFISSLGNNPINIMGVYPIIFRYGLSLFSLFVFSSVVVAVSMFFWTMGKKLYFIPIAFLSILFFTFSHLVTKEYFFPSSYGRLPQREMFSTLQEIYKISSDKKMGILVDVFQQGSVTSWFVFNYNFYFPFDFKVLDETHLVLPEIIITTVRDFPDRHKGAKLAGFEPARSLYLFVMPGKIQNELNKKGFLLPIKDSPSSAALFNEKNFYEDKIWTKGDSVLKNIDYEVGSEDKSFILHTKGWGYYKNDLQKLDLRVFINNTKLEFKKSEGNSYYFKMPKGVAKVNEIRIVSTTFNPKEMGINSDDRALGIDVDSIEFAGLDKSLPLSTLECDNCYEDKIWTKGDSVLKNIDYEVGPEDKSFILHTKGWGYYKNDLQKLDLRVFINNTKLEFKKSEGNSYYFNLTDSLKKVDTIRIQSNTFIPEVVGISSDDRALGIDLNSIEFSAQ